MEEESKAEAEEESGSCRVSFLCQAAPPSWLVCVCDKGFATAA